jgi:antitoxin ParD1/3/4
MAKISISLPDELVTYLDHKVENRSALIESLLQQWRQQQEDRALAQACALVDELNLGWDTQWQSQVITDWEASGW